MKTLFKTAAALAGALAIVPPAAASGGAEAGGSLLTPNPGTIFWTVLTFIALVFLLRRYAWGPLLAAIDAREQSIRDTIAEADGKRTEAASLLDEQRKMLAEARRERAEALEQGKRDALRVKEEILEEARKQREQVLKETEAQVEAGLRKARGDLRGTAVELAILAAGKLLAKNLDDATQRRLVEEHLSDLERRSGESLPS